MGRQKGKNTLNNIKTRTFQHRCSRKKDLKNNFTKIIEALKEEMKNSFKKLEEINKLLKANQEKIKQMRQTAQILKIEIEAIKKTQTEGTLDAKNLGK